MCKGKNIIYLTEVRHGKIETIQFSVTLAACGGSPTSRPMQVVS